MAERQETSVMASIQDLLRDHQEIEEKEKVAAQQRAEDEERSRQAAMLRQQQDEERRLREEEEARQRKVFEEQRKAAEISALQEATVQRAKMEAEAQARMAEMTSRQEHERHLAALHQDKSKKNLKLIAILTGVVLVVAVFGGGYALYTSSQEQKAAKQQLADLQGQVAQAQQDKAKLEQDLSNTKDPEKIQELQAKLAEQDQKIGALNKDLSMKGTSPNKPAYGGGGGGGSCRRRGFPLPLRRRRAALQPRAIRSAPACSLGSRRFAMNTSPVVFALDLPSVESARAMAVRVAPAIGMLKIGLELFIEGGRQAVAIGGEVERPVFLDLKLHDIPETVDRAVARACGLGVKMLTVHASGGPTMLRRAVERAAKEKTGLVITAVTVLTSFDASELGRIGGMRDRRRSTTRRSLHVSRTTKGSVRSSARRTKRARFAPSLGKRRRS